MKLQHYVTIAVAVLIAAINAYLANGGPPIVVGGVSVLAIVVTVLALFQSPPSNPPGPGATGVMLFIGIVTLSLGLGGCAQVKAAMPMFDALAAVIAQDFEEGKSDAQIASDACRALGGTAQTDAACASVEIVVQDVVTVLIDMRVLSPAARIRAAQYTARQAARAFGAFGEQP